MADILRLVVADGLRTVTIGIVIGLIGSLALGRLVVSLLYGISPRDPVILLGAGLTLGAIAIGASLIPAIRAARVDPVTSLRAD